MANKIAHCSWCYKKTEHKLIKRNDLFTRDDYQCSACGNFTVICRAPQCTNMATYKPKEWSANSIIGLIKEQWASEFCAEHDGTLSDTFDHMHNIKITSLSDYTTIFPKGKNVNWVNVSKICGTIVVAAPMAWSTPLDLLLGGALFGDVVYSYMKSLDFEIKTLSENDGDTINIFIHGFMTNGDDFQKWTKNFNLDGNNYGLDWESGTLLKWGEWLTNVSTKGLLLGAKSIIKNKSIISGGVKGSFVVVLSLLNLWYKAIVQSHAMASILSIILLKLDTNKKINLFGHSLGGRVIHSVLDILATTNTKIINDVVIMGGATGCAGQQWHKAIQAINGKIYNFYLDKDKALLAYTLLPLGDQPVGLSKIDLKTDKIVNHNVSSYVAGHTNYQENFPRILEEYQILKINPQAFRSLASESDGKFILKS